MLFPTFEFLFFFCFVLIFNWFLKRWPLAWRLFLLLSSYFFYSVWDNYFLLIIIAVSFFNFLSGLLIYKSPYLKKLILALAILANLFALLLFKYYDFFRVSAELFFEKIGLPFHLPLLEIILPIGLSFYIFRTVSYNIDIYLKKIKPASCLDFFIYVAFFPQLLSGPIMRTGQFLPQLVAGGVRKIENLSYYLSLFLTGLFKKLFIASYLSLSLTDDDFAVPENHSLFIILLAILAYSLVIYFDFSGYSDMAIGLAGLMGFQTPLNFETPYLSLSLRDFWRRWHITLSDWIRDYVYIPLGGSRKGAVRTYLNLFIVMVLIGLWHGPAFHFIVWGALHGIGLAVNHAYDNYQQRKKVIFSNFRRIQKERYLIIKRLFAWLMTFSFITFSWIFFRAVTIESAFNFMKVIFNPQKIVEPFKLYVLILILSGFAFFLFENYIIKGLTIFQKKLPLIIWLLFIILIIILLFKISPDTIPNFIYFSF